jgi:hypothetical protein
MRDRVPDRIVVTASPSARDHARYAAVDRHRRSLTVFTSAAAVLFSAIPGLLRSPAAQRACAAEIIETARPDAPPRPERATGGLPNARIDHHATDYTR